MYDLRAREATLSFLAHTRAVLGVELDPFVEHRLATFSEDAHGEVKVWDLRSLRDNTPIFSFRAAAPAAPAPAPSAAARAGRASVGSGLAQLGWCPTQRDILCSICDAQPTLTLWHIGTGSAVGGGADAVCERSYEVDGSAAAFEWHPTQPSRMLLLLRRATELTLQDLRLHQAPPISFGPRATLLFAAQQGVHVAAAAPLIAALPAPAAPPLHPASRAAFGSRAADGATHAQCRRRSTGSRCADGRRCRFAASSIAEMGGAAMAIGTARLGGRVFDALARGPAHA